MSKETLEQHHSLFRYSGRNLHLFCYGKMYFLGAKMLYVFAFNSYTKAVETFIKPKWISLCTYFLWTCSVLCEWQKPRPTFRIHFEQWTPMLSIVYILLLTKPWNNASLICWTLLNGKYMLFKSFVSYYILGNYAIQNSLARSVLQYVHNYFTYDDFTS